MKRVLPGPPEAFQGNEKMPDLLWPGDISYIVGGWPKNLHSVGLPAVSSRTFRC
jgi:hypothetical protein